MFKKGINNLLTDVPGVSVGHRTIQHDEVHTGVTAIIPHQGNLFRQKLPAAIHVINGFGKSAGTIQVEELGTLETPIILTNTFGVGTASNALIRDALTKNPEIGETTGTVNPLVFECNDGEINDIRKLVVTEGDVFAAIEAADEIFEEGSIGAGTGMRSYELKGGIGSASRQLTLDERNFTIGCLVLTNYGRLADLVIDGYPVGIEIAEFYADSLSSGAEKGSVIVVLATDMPLSSRQLKRISKRASVGITRSGAFIGNGSGEIVISFSTAQRINHFEKRTILPWQVLNENKIDKVFQVIPELVDEAVMHSLLRGQAVKTRKGRPVRNLLECMEEIQKNQHSATREIVLEKLKSIKNRIHFQ